MDYFIVAKEAMPEIFLKVLAAKKLIESGRFKTVSAALHEAGVSRSAFYKYKDLVSPFYEKNRHNTITIAMNLEDLPGYLSGVLTAIAGTGANILTINQSIPINGIANITITLETKDTNFIEDLRQLTGVQSLKILARE